MSKKVNIKVVLGPELLTSRVTVEGEHLIVRGIELRYDEQHRERLLVLTIPPGGYALEIFDRKAAPRRKSG